MTPEDLATAWLKERGARLVGERRIENRHTKALAHIFRGSRPDGTAARCMVVVVGGVPGDPVEITSSDRKMIGKVLGRGGR